MREAWRNVRINLLIFSALLALALLVIRFERAAPFLAEHGETLDYAAGLATGADYDALSSLAPFEIRGRFAAKIGECLGLTRDTYPLRVETLPGRLRIRGPGDAPPLVEFDLGALQEGGPLADFARRSQDPMAGTIAVAARAAGLLGVYAPDAPCPPGGDG